MTKDSSLFGLRFGSNEKLHPTQEELSAFLMSAKRGGEGELHADDFATYSRLLEDVETFARHRQQGAAGQELRQKMFYSALDHSSFFHPGLKSAVEQYKYQVHALLTLDFKKPTAFIRSAEEEMGRLNPKRKDDALKLAKLQGMVDERKKTVETLKRHGGELAKELKDIALYIRDNLIKIEKICATAIVILADLRNAGQEENRLIEDIKILFKERLRSALHGGQITQQHLETAKTEVAVLSKELTSILREDARSLTELYEAIRDHTQKTVLELDARLAKLENKKDKNFETDGELFAQIEQVFVSLVSGHRFELRPAEVSTETPHIDILKEKRKEALDRILELLPKERRSRGERRSGEERRRTDDPDYPGTQRRDGHDRRSGKDRRT